MSPLAKPGKSHLWVAGSNFADCEHEGNYTFDLSCPITSGESAIWRPIRTLRANAISLDTYRATVAYVKVTLCAARALASGDQALFSGIFALA